METGGEESITKRELGSERADVLSLQSRVAQLSPTQSLVCAEVRGLLTIFLAPQMPWQLRPWLSKQQTMILGISWQYAQICHKIGRGCCQGVIVVPLVPVCHFFLACQPGGMTSSDYHHQSCWISEMWSWSWSLSCCSC